MPGHTYIVIGISQTMSLSKILQLSRGTSSQEMLKNSLPKSKIVKNN
jgi:hypothetical protein